MTTLRKQTQAVADTKGYVELLEITNPSFSEPMRVVNQFDDVFSKGQHYVGLRFGFTIPEDVSGQAPKMTLRIDNVGRAFSEELEGMTPGTVTMAKLIVVSKDTLDNHAHIYKLPISSITVDGASIEATCSSTELAARPACLLIANPHTLPGIF